jgi:hypothetical protein
MKKFMNKQARQDNIHNAGGATNVAVLRMLVLVAAVVLVPLGTPTVAVAQSGGAAVPFLLIGPDSRASGMGDASTGLADDLNAIHWNPGGLAFQYDRQLALNYSRWLPQFNADLFYSQGAYSQYLAPLQGTIYGSFTLMNLGEFTRTDINGRELGKFLSNEFVVNLGYATTLGEDWGIGVTAKYIQSNLGARAGTEGGGVGISVAADVGLMWKPSQLKIADLDLSDRFSFGMTLRNLGPSMTYSAFSDPLPQMIRLGLAADLIRDEFNQLTVLADYGKLLIRRYDNGDFDRFPFSLATGWQSAGFEMSGGLEYWYDKLVALRAGYFTDLGSLPIAGAGRRYFTVGGGIHYDIFFFNFSFIIPVEQNHPLANTARFSLLINFNNGAVLTGQKPAQ